MTLTLRARLMLWYTLAFFAVLTLVLCILALELHQQLSDEAHDKLLTEETWVSTLFETEFQPLLQATTEKDDSLLAELPEDLEERYGLKRQFALLRLEHGAEKRYYSGGLKNIDRLLPFGFLEQGTGNYDVQIAGNRYRVRVFHRDWGRVAVGVENDTIFKVAQKTGQVLLWVVPLSVLLASGGGWILAKMAMRPVALAARAAESISVANLQERLQDYAGKDEFGALVATLNRMISRLEEGVKRLQQFTQDAAHELRTPLAILRGDLELAYQDEKLSDDTRIFLQKMLDRVIALGGIVDNLMLLARSDAGNYPFKKKLFRFDALVHEIFEDLQILAEGRALSLQLRTCEALEFWGDELLMRRLLLNLCDNALKYTCEGKIVLALRKSRDNVVFTISDTGAGISAEDLPHIFDRFYRADKSRTNSTGGSGLGLAICKWIVTAHHGKIDLTSTPGAGTTVRVSLPGKFEAVMA
ncbi:HAMP domain-containing histidine kinase [candidate division KSB1 bacterium]|nr:HAMP domain-containing histidine kinase [candidate division KSB1 bacterium]